jgi:hypothetical protein
MLSGVGPTFTYTPAANFHGSDSFTFRVNDGSNNSNTSTVSITINPVNDVPVAASQSVTTNSNTAVSITLAGTDVETAPAELIFEITAAPSHGTLSGSGAGLSYTPVLNYSGPDSFKFTVRDTGDGSAGPATSAEATVSITVNDTVAPTITAPANVTVNTGAGATTCGTVVNDAALGNATAADNSGSVNVVRSGVPAGNVFAVGTTTVTYTATDNAGNSAQATQTVTVIDNTAPAITAPAPVTVNAGLIATAPVPNFVASTIATDNCGSVTLSQSPLAGTTVGLGTHVITITATDSAGNTSTATTTFTVNGGGLNFSITVSPNLVERGRAAKVDLNYQNTTNERIFVSYVVRYVGPCDSGLVDSGGSVNVNARSDRNVNLQFHVPKEACTGEYTLTLETYVNGVLIGTASAGVTVTPGAMNGKRLPGRRP